MKKIFTSIVFLVTALLAPSLAKADDEQFLKTPCQVSVPVKRVAFFSNEPGRIWQIAFLNDLREIKKRKGKIKNEALLKTNKALSTRLTTLIENRIIFTEKHQEEYQNGFLLCLDRKNEIRFKNELTDLRQSHKKATDELWRIIFNSRKATKNKVKILKKKLRKKKIKRATFSNRRSYLFNKKRNIYLNTKNKIKEEGEKLNKGVEIAQKAFTDQVSINQELAFEKAIESYTPILKEVVTENAPALKKTKESITKLISNLNERTRDPAYRWVKKGPLKIKWTEVKKSPTLKGEKPISVKSRTKFF